MNSTRTKGSRSEQHDTNPLLKVMVVFQDTIAGLRARRALDILPPVSAAEPAFRLRLWRWELLSDPLLKERAVHEASIADVILLSGDASGQLPEAVREWLTRWLVRKYDRPYAIGLLIDSSLARRVEKGEACSFVRSIAEAGNADFFFGCSETIIARYDTSGGTQSQPRQNHEYILAT